MLYVYAIQQRHAPLETYLPAFQAATKCQSLITTIAIPGSLAQRYGVVLQELRLELLRHNNHLLAMTANAQVGNQETMKLEGDDAVLGALTNLDMLGSNGGDLIGIGQNAGNANSQLPLEDPLGFVDGSPGSSIIQMTGWGQFDSLVSSAQLSFKIIRLLTSKRSLVAWAGSTGFWGMATWIRGIWEWGMVWAADRISNNLGSHFRGTGLPEPSIRSSST